MAAEGKNAQQVKMTAWKLLTVSKATWTFTVRAPSQWANVLESYQTWKGRDPNEKEYKSNSAHNFII